MDTKMGRARILGRVAALGTATFATLLATGVVGAGAAQAATVTASAVAPAQLTAHGVSESFTLPAGVNAMKVGAGSTYATVTRSARVSPNNAIPCNLSVTNPAYYSGSGGSGVQSTATIRCAYPTTVYLQIGLTYNGSTSVYNGQSFPANYVASLSVSTSATPGYYQSNAIGILGDGEQYGYVYSSNVYIPQ